MDGISWSDLNLQEQRVLAMMRDGVSTEFCDPVALLTLQRIGFLKGRRLTEQAENLFRAAAVHEFAA